MGLKLIFLIVSRAVSLLGFDRRASYILAAYMASGT
jgi:hypothetical protein